MIKVTTVMKIIGGLFIVLLCVIIFILTHTKPLSIDECYRLGSNERMLLCLQEVKTREMKNEPSLGYLSDLSQVSIEDAKMMGNSYYEPNPTFQATLRNNSKSNLYNVILRFSFFNSGSGGSCDSPSADTRYITASEILPKGDSQRINTVVKTNFDTSGQFQWCVKVVAARADSL